MTTTNRRHDRHQWTLLGPWLIAACASTVACSSEETLGTIRAPETVSPGGDRVLFAYDGKLIGGIDGYAWVLAGGEADVQAPNPCNLHGCFRGTQGRLCTHGNLPALSCTGQGTPQLACNWSSNWGVMIGLNPTATRDPWGPGAPKTVSVTYAGGAGNYRLSAHVAGDPDEKDYCIDGYVSGLSVEPSRLRSACWSDAGQPLPSFSVVDRLGLLLTSTQSPVAFDYCISGITLNAAADTGRVLISGDGKLGGSMNGYSWVAGAQATDFTSPNPCNDTGCFRNTGGKLCAKGAIQALQCTGQGTAQYTCDWSSNWGAMIGMNPTAAHTAWGALATGSVAFTYAGGPGTYRLTAHVAGDPYSRSYCIRNYRSGSVVTANQFKTECWSNSGAALARFADVDSFGLMITSAETPVAFDYCISGISAR
jgi:hypothetical protein